MALTALMLHLLLPIICERLIDKADISYNREGIGFVVKGKPQGDVVPLMVEIQHH